MTLQRRLLLFGALVPTLLMAMGFVSTGLLLERQLLDATDRALLSQAAIESVSLFDSPDGTPHLHLARSPLSEAVAGFAPHASLFDPRGAPVARFDAGHLGPRRLDPARVGRRPSLRTIEQDGIRIREVRVAVDSPAGERFALWVGVPLESVERTRNLYARTAAAVLLAASLLFFLLQRREASGLSNRLERLAQHAAGLREGRFDPPAPDDHGDVVSELRDAVAEATDRLRSSHESEKRLVADAAHELRTPLTAMRAVIDTTLRRERSVDELREALTNTRSEVDRLTTLASELLDLTAMRQVEAAKEWVDVGDLLATATDALRSLARERGVELAVSLPGSELRARAVPAQLRRAVENLVLNAIRFAPSGTSVRIVASQPSGRLRIAVEDEGDGVPPAEREAIFEPFRRGVEHRGRGAGLGLAIVRDVARRHGGDAWVESSNARGARFVLDVGPQASREERP